MREIDVILEEYRHGDLGRRLDLYLQFRSLRGNFDRIERMETPIEKTVESRLTTHLFNQGKALFGSLFRSLKYCCFLFVQRLDT